jgi:large subunit ribosomal protein LP1
MIFAPSELQADKISTIVKAANVNVESYWPGLFAKLLDTRSVDDLVLSVGSGIHIAPSRIALSCVNCFHIFVDA